MSTAAAQQTPIIPTVIESPGLKHGTRRVCMRCGEPQDKSNFGLRRHPKTGNLYYDAQCRECRRESNRRKKRLRREKEQAAKFREQVARLRGLEIKAPHISEVWATVISQYGGLDKFVEQWKAQIGVAEQNNGGSKTVLDAYKSLANLAVHSSSMRGSAPDMAALTDAELEQQLRGLAMRTIQDNPQMVQDLIAKGLLSLPAPEPRANPDYADPHGGEATDGQV